MPSQRRLAVPVGRFGLVLRHAVACGIHAAQPEPRLAMSLFRRLAEPFGCQGLVLRHAVACGIHAAELEGRLVMPSQRRLAVPAGGFGFVLRHASAFGIHVAQQTFRPDIPLIRQLLTPAGHFGPCQRVRFKGQIALGSGMALLGCLAIPEQRFFLIPGQAVALGVQLAQTELRFNVSQSGRQAATEGGIGLVHPATALLPLDEKRVFGNGTEADGGKGEAYGRRQQRALRQRPVLSLAEKRFEKGSAPEDGTGKRGGGRKAPP